MDVYNQIVDYLKMKTGGKLVMSSAQLAKELPISIKQQSKLRKENDFPIPSQTIGRNIYYSIFHVADFLINGKVYNKEKAPVDNIKEEVVKVKKDVQRTKKKDVQSLSHLFLLKALSEKIAEEAKNLTLLSESLTKFSDSSSLYNNLSSDLKDEHKKPENLEKV